MKPLVLILLLLAPVAHAADTEEQAAPHLRPVVSERIAFTQMRQRTFPGTIKAEHETILAFQTIGRIASVTVETGDMVAKGDVLATLDRVTLQEEVDAAKAALSAARAKADFAKVSLERVQTLSQRGIATTAQLEGSQAQNDAALAQLASAQADLESALEALEYSKLTAPTDGIVIARQAEQGMIVAAGAPVLTLAGTSGRDAVIDVPTDYLPLLTDRSRFEVRAYGPGSTPVLAELRLIEPVVDETLRNRRLRLRVIDAPSNFRIGTLISAGFAQAAAPIVTLPTSAIGQAPDGPFVWRVTPETRVVSRVTVTLGETLGDRIVVIEGLSPNDEIIVKGIHSLNDGQIVGERVK